MPSSDSSDDDLFKPNHISLSVSANDALQFLEDYGFFYQENAKIGKLVEELFNTGRERSDDARIHYFQPTLREDLRISSIIDQYPIELGLSFPWGTTQNGFYNWAPKSDPRTHSDLVAHMLGPNSEWTCRPGSHRLDSDGAVVGDGTCALADDVLAGYPKKEVRMQEGGILLMKPRVAQQSRRGRSIMLAVRKKEMPAVAPLTSGTS